MNVFIIKFRDLMIFHYCVRFEDDFVVIIFQRLLIRIFCLSFSHKIRKSIRLGGGASETSYVKTKLIHRYISRSIQTLWFITYLYYYLSFYKPGFTAHYYLLCSTFCGLQNFPEHKESYCDNNTSIISNVPVHVAFSRNGYDFIVLCIITPIK